MLTTTPSAGCLALSRQGSEACDPMDNASMLFWSSTPLRRQSRTTPTPPTHPQPRHSDLRTSGLILSLLLERMGFKYDQMLLQEALRKAPSCYADMLLFGHVRWPLPAAPVTQQVHLQGSGLSWEEVVTCCSFLCVPSFSGKPPLPSLPCFLSFRVLSASYLIY